MSEKYLYIFLHIPRTAGTTFVTHIEENIPKEERLRLYSDTVKFPKNVKKINKNFYRDTVFEKIKKISRDRRKKIKIIYGHQVPYGIHKFFNKPARYVAFVRDPVKRTISLYNFFRETYENRLPKSKDEEIFKKIILKSGRLISFRYWLKKRYDKSVYGNSSQSQVKFLQSLGYMANKKVGKSDLKEFFNKFYFVGLTRNYNRDVLYLYYKLGINKYFLRQNVSVKATKVVETEKLSYFIKKINRDDYLLFNEAKERSQKFKKTRNYCQIITIYMGFKRLIILPFTQLYYRPIKTASRFSRFLKRRSKIYSYGFNYFKKLIT